MINGNNFQFYHKSLSNFWKTIYGFQNRKSFFEFKLFILIRTFVEIRYSRALEFVGSPNLSLKVPNFGIRLPEFGCQDSGDGRLPPSRFWASKNVGKRLHQVFC